MSRKTFRRIIVTDETLANINKKNVKLKEQFIQYKELSSSPATIRGYSSDLDIFFSYLYLERDNAFFIDMKKFDIVQFFSFASSELKFGSSRRNRMRSTLSSLSIFVENVLDDTYKDFKNIVLKAVPSAPPSPRREKTVLSDEQVEDILKHFSEEDPQIACYFALAVASGARFSELNRIGVETISNSEEVYDGIFWQTPPIKSKGRGKDGRMQKKYIIKSVFEPYYNAWIEIRNSILENNNMSHDSLFIKRDGSPATVGIIRGWGKKISEYSGESVYFHSLRHFMVSTLVRKGLAQELIINLMGWKSGGAMFNIYNDVEFTERDWDGLDVLK